jgi:hypothetical protein
VLPESKKCPIAHLVRDLPMLPVVVELLGCLCLLQAVVYISQEGLTSLHVLGDGGHLRLPWLIRADGRRVPAIYHMERRVPE